MFSSLSSFHTSLSSPHSYFTNPSINLFPTSDFPPNTTPCLSLTSELTQSHTTSMPLDLPSVPCEEPAPIPVRRSTQEASTNPLWQQAMNKELQALEKTHTWDYVDLPPSKKPIGFYMKPPPGTTPPLQKVCLLFRALYGLEQASRAWFATFSSTITQLRFTSSSHNSALFTRQTSRGIVLLPLYVDDMIITGDDSHAISDLQCYLGKHFEMKDLGNLSYFLDL
ncbi:putative mitochondrial protein [Cucumis melo var. makuwa]|uniref:Mitochondrial protein n=1 Tax=Cucumis melo var. makuwa TaxID=1194695 RepID=A0A5D3CHE7_CUCMM|nr:putative mitochondrial protein [Cucumis melo var. makuwa]TYK11221.1 putative mitochondrial protein [Cucumis melo var. makuwa]